MKSTNLRAKIFIQSLAALCALISYHIPVVYHFEANFHFITFFVVIVSLLIENWKLKKSTDAMDEYARKALRIADAVCFKMSLILMWVLVLPFSFPQNPIENPIQMAGYLLYSGIFLLFLVRACIFFWYDKKGMDQ